MAKRSGSVFTVAICVVLQIYLGTSRIAGQQVRKTTIKYPLSCVGIRVGTSTDADVQQRFGKGYFVQNEGHSGGRYYIDTRHQVTLHIELGVDRIVDTVEFQKGIHLPVKPTLAIWKQATTVRLTPNEKMQGVIPLGAQVHTVLRLYGKPIKNRVSNGVRTIEYSADEHTMQDVLFYEAKFRFRNDRLIAIALYNGE